MGYSKARLTAGLRCPGPRRPDSNRHLSAGQAVALPVELPRGRTRGVARRESHRKMAKAVSAGVKWLAWASVRECPLTSRGLTRSAVLPDWVVTSVGCDSGLQGQGCRRTRLASRHCRDTSPRARRTSVRADCSHEPRESPRQSRPGLGEMTNEEVGGSIRYGVGIDAEEHVIGSFDPLHLAGSTDCLQRLMHQCALFRR